MKTRDMMIKALKVDKFAGKVMKEVAVIGDRVNIVYTDKSERWVGDITTTMLQVLKVWDSIQLHYEDGEKYTDYSHYLSNNIETVIARAEKEEYFEGLFADAVNVCLGVTDPRKFIHSALTFVQASIELLQDEKDIFIESHEDIDVYDNAAWHAKGADKPEVGEA